ncbi:hypothetical protein Tco_0381311 [Tanacetum coccineum]
MTKSQDGETRLCLVDDLTVLKITSPLTTDDDRQVGEELKDASTDEIPLSDDFDDRPNEYDLMDSFINDGPLENEATQEDSDSDN